MMLVASPTVGAASRTYSNPAAVHYRHTEYPSFFHNFLGETKNLRTIGLSAGYSNKRTAYGSAYFPIGHDLKLEALISFYDSKAKMEQNGVVLRTSDEFEEFLLKGPFDVIEFRFREQGFSSYPVAIAYINRENNRIRIGYDFESKDGSQRPDGELEAIHPFATMQNGRGVRVYETKWDPYWFDEVFREMFSQRISIIRNIIRLMSQ